MTTDFTRFPLIVGSVEVLEHTRIFPISNLPEEIFSQIFFFLDRDSSGHATLVCWNWNRLNTYPFGQLPLRTLNWGKRLQSSLLPETFERTGYKSLDRRTKKPLLDRFSTDDYCSLRPLVSVSEEFIRTDAINKSIAYGKKNLSEEIKADSQLKAMLEEVFEIEKAHSLAYQPFYHYPCSKVPCR
jgi:hypothetical protein